MAPPNLSPQVLRNETEWLKQVIQFRIAQHNNPHDAGDFPEPPALNEEEGIYASFAREHSLKKEERLVLALCLATWLKPNLLDLFIADQQIFQLSKVRKTTDGTCLVPTVNTALFLLSGDDIGQRISCLAFFETEHLFYKKSIIELGPTDPHESRYNAIVHLSPHYRDQFIFNEHRPPRFSTDFPAHLLTSKFDWEDLILMPGTSETLEDVKITLKQYEKLLHEWKMDKVMRPGCRVLLYGDSGQGKTLTASLLGKLLDRPVYRVDISAAVSKYVGETNQRLEALFNTAENKDWILFFDEGDAMLGQRSQGGGESATSHYANQEVAFLLQRIETFNGIIIVATNLRSNIDYAFQRRFDTAAQFKALDAERQRLVWDRFWPKAHLELAPGIDLDLLIKRHGLSPASIVNVIRRIASHMAEKEERVVPAVMLQRFIQDEEYKFKGVAGFS